MNAAARRFPPRAAHVVPSDPAGRVLAIDYGRRRIGLALSDALGMTAQPLATLARTNRRDDMRRLREIVRQNDVRHIVVGNPVHLDGSASEMAAEAARFATRVAKELGVPVELVDERLTSWEAGQVLATGAAPPRKRLGSKPRRRSDRPIDHIAAAILLRDYLEHRHTHPKAGG